MEKKQLPTGVNYHNERNHMPLEVYGISVSYTNEDTRYKTWALLECVKTFSFQMTSRFSGSPVNRIRFPIQQLALAHVGMMSVRSLD